MKNPASDDTAHELRTRDGPRPSTLPPLAVDVAGRGRVVVAVDPSGGPTVGDLADALGIGGRHRVSIDGRPHERRTPLLTTGVRQGSSVAAAADTCRRRARSDAAEGPGVPGPAIVTVEVEAGPDAGRSFALAAGRHVIGRAGAAGVRIDDDAVELHHAVVDVAPSATEITQLAGRAPLRRPSCDGTGADAGEVVLVGASRLRVATAQPVAQAAHLVDREIDPWRLTVHRPPRAVTRWEPEPLAVPPGWSAGIRHAGSIVAAASSLVGGAVIAVVMRNPTFLLFGTAGLLGTAGAIAVGRWRWRKDERARRARSRRDVDRFVAALAAQRAVRRDALRRVVRGAGDAVVTAGGPTVDLWARRTGHDDAFVVGLGWGVVAWEAAVVRPSGPRGAGSEFDDEIAAAERFDDAPVAADLGAGAALAVVGDHATAVARALLVQLAVFTGPADWRLLVVSAARSRWAWTEWLPHAGPVVDADDPAAIASAAGRLDGDDRHVVVVTDRPDLLATLTGPLRRAIAAATSAAVVAVIEPGGAVPAMCGSVVELGSLWAARWSADTSLAASSSAVHAAGVSERVATDVARRLAALHDPEDPSESAAVVPAAVGLGALLAGDDFSLDDPIALAARWRRAAVHPVAVIGATADGVVEIDLVRDGPHALIAGTTGSGKSELLRTLVASLAARSSPDDVTFVLVDYKGGSTFDACADLPHTVGVVTDLDEHLAARVLTSLEAEIRRRERLLRSVGADDLDAYRAAPGPEPRPALARLVVVIDEFAALAAELPGFLAALVGVAQRGRSLGLHLVLATQRPAGVVSDEIRANTNLRIALRLHDRADALDVVGDAAPARFSRAHPGRAMLRLGPGETIEFQSATATGRHRAAPDAPVLVVDDPASVERPSSVGRTTPAAPAEPSELVVLARTARAAASLCDLDRPARPWLEPLPRHLGGADLPAVLGAADGSESPLPEGVVGVIDDPADQRRRPLRWEASTGNLALVGSLGAGTTTALRSLMAIGSARFYVLDARGDGDLEPVGTWPGCGGVVGRHDAERRGRVLRLLADEIAARQRGGTTGAGDRILLAVDGLAGLLEAVSGPGEADERAALQRIVDDGVAVGVSCVATLERGAGVPMAILGGFGQRWVFHLDDPNEAGAFGVRSALVPPAIPGRLVVAATGLEAHVAVVEPTDAASSPPSLPPIAALPARVAREHLPPAAAVADGTRLPVGTEFVTLAPAVIEIPDGEHALVVGPARSGRSTALIVLAAAWIEARPDTTVVVRGPRRSPLLAWAAAAPVDVGPVATVLIAGSDEDLTARVAALTESPGVARRRCLIVIDDAEAVVDDGHLLHDLAAARRADVTIAAAGRPEALRANFGSWTSVVRRSRLGMVMSGCAEADGELLGEFLPRRLPIPARPGLAWVVDAGGRRLAQVATAAAGDE